MDGCELFNDFAGQALHLDTDQAGFGWGLTAETPKGRGHFKDEGFLNWVGGFPCVEVGVLLLNDEIVPRVVPVA